MRYCLLIGLLLAGCGQMPAEQLWVHEMDRRCGASKSQGSYNKETKVYECWNRPFMRRPKLTFKEKYRGL